jgi:hypothetical protein
VIKRPIASWVIANELCGALGLDASLVRSLQINVNNADAVNVTVDMLMTADGVKTATAILQRYDLIPHGEAIKHDLEPEVFTPIEEVA